MKRRISRPIFVGGVQIGGGAPVSVQSMTKTDTRDIASTIRQIWELEEAGCEIVRVAVPDEEAAAALAEIIKGVKIPVIADIHFNYRLALAALRAGAAGLRINPGNIGGIDKVKEVVLAAKERGVPIRIGVNAGSLSKKILQKYGGITAGAMVESALEYINVLEHLDFYNIKVSLKASNVPLMVEAYRQLAQRVDYPFHLGVTEAGLPPAGVIKSAVGIGILLSEGIGDTIRVSLTGDPCLEVHAAYEILKTLGLRRHGPELISCPTCGRTRVDLVKIAREVEERLKKVNRPLKVAVMGCAVNGPGEAREADVGLAAGRGAGIIFRKGKIVRRVPENSLVDELMSEIERL